MRMRRLRKSKILRKSLAEVSFSLDNLVNPIFLVESNNTKTEIKSMPGIYQISPDLIVDEVSNLYDQGLTNFILFGIPSNKDHSGKEASNPDGVVPMGLKSLKDHFGDKIVLYADVCLCEYTTHGHCGIPNNEGKISNDESLDFLAEAALTYARSGADWVAPSNMMDFRVSSIREKLDSEGFSDTAILSYSAKFASNYYGPFRDAAESPPQFGDRKSYQIDYRSKNQPLREVIYDESQGADAVMVKPALAYLDIIAKVRNHTMLPLYVYNVSGEYSMIKIGAAQGIFDEKDIVMENLTSMFRAGADMVITYHGLDIVENGWLNE